MTRQLGWLVAITFLIATVMILLLSFDITAPGVTYHEGESVLVDNILLDFANQGLRWPQELVANLLYAIGFAGIAALGATLPRRLGADDDLARLVGVTLVIAGTLGVVGQLVYIGVKELAINTQYCECALRDPQLISRAESLALVGNAQGWLTDGFAVLFGVGLLAASRVAAVMSAMTGVWRTYTRWFGVAAIAYVVLRHLLDAAGGPEGAFDDLGLMLLGVVAGVLTPIWGFLTATASSEN